MTAPDLTIKPFVPYRFRPALDKGELITWRELESGMLFEPLAGEPSLRRVRGVPIDVDHGYLIGSEDAATGRPTGGVVGTDLDAYRRHYRDDGRAVYTLAWDVTAQDVPFRPEELRVER